MCVTYPVLNHSTVCMQKTSGRAGSRFPSVLLGQVPPPRLRWAVRWAPNPPAAHQSPFKLGPRDRAVPGIRGGFQASSLQARTTWRFHFADRPDLKASVGAEEMGAQRCRHHWRRQTDAGRGDRGRSQIKGQAAAVKTWARGSVQRRGFSQQHRRGCSELGERCGLCRARMPGTGKRWGGGARQRQRADSAPVRHGDVVALNRGPASRAVAGRRLAGRNNARRAFMQVLETIALGK